MDDKKFGELLRQRSEYKKARDEKYNSDSRDRLNKIVKKKIETTMIGALSSIEKHLGFLWENEDGSDLTPEQQELFDIYQIVRSEILDKGNGQKRNLDAELSQYDVCWKKYSIQLPMKPKGRTNNE